MHSWSTARLRCPITISPGGSAAPGWSHFGTNRRFTACAIRRRERSSCRRARSTNGISLPLTDWVEVGPEGTVTGFTVVRYAEPYQPLPIPYGLALIRLDGADTALTHIVRQQDLDRLKVGGRVRAVFAEKRTASILDIAWFEPV